uniref:Uncharacterized protein n=1 Tax=Ciona intestinalis TaxID=7719 RepID=H2Y3M2_CIOIN
MIYNFQNNFIVKFKDVLIRSFTVLLKTQWDTVCTEITCFLMRLLRVTVLWLYNCKYSLFTIKYNKKRE